MPSIVDIVHRDAAVPAAGRYWRLSPVGGAPLDASMSLNDSDIRDGDVLLLTETAPPVAIRAQWDASRLLTRAGTGVPNAGVVPALCCVLLGVFGAVALVLSAVPATTTVHIVTGVLVAVGAAAGAVVARRVHGDPMVCLPLSLVAVASAAGVGFLAVPSGSTTAHVLLAAAATFATSIVVMRLIGCGTTLLTAVATSAGLTTGAATAGVAWQLRPDATGAVLATASLASLGVAPRLSMALHGIRPPPLDTDAPEASAADTVAARAPLAHLTLTGLVTGSAVSSATGAALVAVGSIHADGSAVAGTAFIAVVALVLVLRVRTHADATRRISLAGSAIGAAAAGFAVAAVSAPALAPVISVVAAAAGAAALSATVGVTVSPVIRRTVDVVEYVALAAVVPAACWVAGVYGLARGMSLR